MNAAREKERAEERTKWEEEARKKDEAATREKRELTEELRRQAARTRQLEREWTEREEREKEIKKEREQRHDQHHSKERDQPKVKQEQGLPATSTITRHHSSSSSSSSSADTSDYSHHEAPGEYFDTGGDSDENDEEHAEDDKSIVVTNAREKGSSKKEQQELDEEAYDKILLEAEENEAITEVDRDRRQRQRAPTSVSPYKNFMDFLLVLYHRWPPTKTPELMAYTEEQRWSFDLRSQAGQNAYYLHIAVVLEAPEELFPAPVRRWFEVNVNKAAGTISRTRTPSTEALKAPPMYYTPPDEGYDVAYHEPALPLRNATLTRDTVLDYRLLDHEHAPVPKLEHKAQVEQAETRIKRIYVTIHKCEKCGSNVEEEGGRICAKCRALAEDEALRHLRAARAGAGGRGAATTRYMEYLKQQEKGQPQQRLPLPSAYSTMHSSPYTSSSSSTAVPSFAASPSAATMTASQLLATLPQAVTLVGAALLGATIDRVYSAATLSNLLNTIIDAKRSDKLHHVNGIIDSCANKVQKWDGADFQLAPPWIRRMSDEIIKLSMTPAEAMALLRQCVKGNLASWLQREEVSAVSVFAMKGRACQFEELLRRLMDEHLGSDKSSFYIKRLISMPLDANQALVPSSLSAHYAKYLSVLEDARMCSDIVMNDNDCLKWYKDQLPKTLTAHLWTAEGSCRTASDYYTLASNFVNRMATAEMLQSGTTPRSRATAVNSMTDYDADDEYYLAAPMPTSSKKVDKKQKGGSAPKAKQEQDNKGDIESDYNKERYQLFKCFHCGRPRHHTGSCRFINMPQLPAGKKEYAKLAEYYGDDEPYDPARWVRLYKKLKEQGVPNVDKQLVLNKEIRNKITKKGKSRQSSSSSNNNSSNSANSYKSKKDDKDRKAGPAVTTGDDDVVVTAHKLKPKKAPGQHLHIDRDESEEEGSGNESQ